jgi:hypothetical protein
MQSRKILFQKHLSYANIIASLALFIALGGTAVAAAALGRDSVGSPQIRTDAVRSPEIQKDAVRSPEIVKDAVRTSEIRDKGVNFADVSTGAAAALRGDLHVAEKEDFQSVPECKDLNLRVCPNLLELPLSDGASRVGQRTGPVIGPGPPAPEPGSNWLIQARMHLKTETAPGSNFSENRCGLVNPAVAGPAAVLDEFPFFETTASRRFLALTAVVKKGANNPTIALRCTSQPSEQNLTDFVKITALEVGAVTGP